MRTPVGEISAVESSKKSPDAIQRKCSTCEDDEKIIQRKPVSSGVGVPSQSPAHVSNAMSSGGRPLDNETRNFFEPRMGHDFRNVRVHTDSTAGQSAKSINAKAYTLGSNIVFGNGEYKPETQSGRHLIAHELAHVGQSRKSGIYRQTIYRQPDDDDKRVAAKPVVCPGGGPPLNGVCISDEILGALLETDIDLEQAQKIVQTRAAKSEKDRERRERTVKKFGGDRPDSAVAAYQKALEQYFSKPDDGTKRKYRLALHRLDQAYQHQVNLFLQDPKWKDKYDLLALQQIIEEQAPQIAATRVQDVNEYLSIPNWSANDQLQMDQLKNDIKGWTEEEQKLARNLLWRWLELAREGRHSSAAKDTIIKMTEQKLEQWLLAADNAREEDCKKNPMGTVEKLYRIHGIDRCKPWFDDKNGKNSRIFHGPSELFDFRMQMRIRLFEDESPRSLVFECVKQYRRHTNIDERLRAMQAQAIVGWGLHLTSVASMATAAHMQKFPIPTTAPMELPLNGVGRIIDTPMGPQRVRAIMRNGDLVLDPIMKVPPANRTLTSGSARLPAVPTAKPPSTATASSSGISTTPQANPLGEQASLPPGSIFLLNGDLVLGPIMKVPPANRTLTSGSARLPAVPTAKPPSTATASSSGIFTTPQANPLGEKASLPPGSIFLLVEAPAATAPSLLTHEPAIKPSVTEPTVKPPAIKPAMAKPAASVEPMAIKPAPATAIADTEAMGAHLTRELGLDPPGATVPSGNRAVRIADAHADAAAAGWVDAGGDPIPEGPIHAVVGEHGDASARRATTGHTGATRESAHIGATSILRTLAGYSRRLAMTKLLPRSTHQAFDHHWMRWIFNRRNAIHVSGSTNYTATLTELLDAQRQAIRQTPNLSPQALSTLEGMLGREFHDFASTLPDGMSTSVPLPRVWGSK